MNFSQVYTRFCKFAGRYEFLRDLQEPSEDLKQNLKLISLDIVGGEIIALAFLSLIIGEVLIGFIFLITLFYNVSFFIPILGALLPVILFFSIGWYPKWRAEKERNKSLAGFPRLISYLTVSLKINPNLEKATSFTARKTNSSLGKNFRTELWKACIGFYTTVEEALSKYSQKWKEESQELKRSIDLLKSSVSERNKNTREQILDQALRTSFEGVQNQMESFAAGLHLPTTIIYGIGVLLPLILLAVLPVLSSTGIQISSTEIGLIYCFVLPIAVYIIEKQILAKRPTAFPPQFIPSKDDENKAVLFSLFTAFVPPILVWVLGFPQSFLILAVLWGLASSISIYCYLSSRKTFKVREMNRDLEEEFCDALTQLGGLLKSNRPAEDAFQKTAEITEGSELSKILEKTSTNLKVGGMSTHSAFFDPEKGSLKNVHSEQVEHAFRMLVSLLNRSTRVAGEAVLHISEHLKELKEVEKQTRRSLQDVVNSMRSVALFFAPLVASITVQLQQLLLDKTRGMPLLGSSFYISSPTFLGILGFYIITLTILLSLYTVEIEYGDDGLMKRMILSKALPIAMTVFTLGLLIGGQMLSILVG